MQAMDFRPLIEQKRRRFEELEAQVGSSSLFENPKRAREIMREHSSVKRVLESWDILEKKQRELEENRALTAGDDSELAELAASEIPDLEVEIEKRSKEVQVALLPPEPHEDRDAIVEVRAGTGGNEAALFAADLYRMYSRYADSHGFKVEELESSPSELGGLKEAIFKVSTWSCVLRICELKFVARAAPAGKA
jgi:peptide chain release factor 1